MDDLISRQAAIEAVHEHLKAVGSGNEGYAIAHRHIAELLKIMPSAQKHGKWIGIDDYPYIGIDDYPYESWECDQCGCIYEEMPSWTPNYCPNCGAYMHDTEKDARLEE